MEGNLLTVIEELFVFKLSLNDIVNLLVMRQVQFMLLLQLFCEIALLISTLHRSLLVALTLLLVIICDFPRIKDALGTHFNGTERKLFLVAIIILKGDFRKIRSTYHAFVLLLVGIHYVRVLFANFSVVMALHV